MRLLTPALMPLTGIVAVLFDLGSVLQRRLLAVSAILVLVAQTWTVVLSRLHDTEDQWDWGQLRKVARTYWLLKSSNCPPRERRRFQFTDDPIPLDMSRRDRLRTVALAI
jgi:hypothetical protein